MNNLENYPDLFTTQELAQFLRVTNQAIIKWGNEHKIPYINLNERGHRRYLKQDIINFIQSFKEY